MIGDFSISEYDEDGNYKGESHYRAQAGGALYTNSWFEEDDNRAYYQADGKACADGIYTIAGKQYSFSNIYLQTEWAVDGPDGTCYIADEEGVLTEANANGWTEQNGRYYYAENGTFRRGGVEKIGDFYYMFDQSGQRLTDSEMTISGWDEENNRWYSKSYYAKEDGTLYVNEWRDEEYDNYRYYYLEDGVRAEDGIYTIDGKQYYFDSYGRCKPSSAVTVDEKNYIADKTGALTEAGDDGWIEVDGERYYAKDGQFLKGCIEKIGDDYYYFTWSGAILTNAKISDWSSEENLYINYRADAEGRLYVNCWFDAGYTKEYYGEGGRGAEGICTIDGVQYAFKNAELQKNCAVEEDGTYYIADTDGLLTEVKNNEWTVVNDKYYYVKNGKLLYNCVEKIGDAYYGFSWDGSRYRDQRFDQWDEANGRYWYYQAKTDGTLVTGWYTQYGNSYYYGADGKGYEGIRTVNGKQYYFRHGYMYTERAVTVDGTSYLCREDGSLQVLKNNVWTYYNGYYYYVKDNQVLSDCIAKIGSSYYGFCANGMMYDEEWFEISGYDENGDWRRHTYFAKAGGALYLNSWVKKYDEWYYAGADGAAYTGLQTINGKKYYFDDGIMQVSRGINTYDTFYVAKSDGTLITAKNNSWVNTEGYWYYVKNDELARDEVVQISGKYYAFDHLGRMATDGMFGLSMEDGSMFWGYASESGELYTNKWVWDESFGTLYVGKDGKALGQGVQTINGVKYLFGTDCNLYRSTFLKVNGKNYAADGDGKAYELKEKWNKVGNYWYYVKNGEVVSSKLETIGSITYYFDYEGHMTTNSLLNHVRDSYYGDDVSVIADADGKVQKNKTYELANGTYMVDEKGNGVEGFRTVNGIRRYFRLGWMLQSTSFQVGDTNYAAADNGKVVQLANNSWTQVDKEWYYVYEGKLITSGRFEIKGKNYIFDSEGRMVSGVAVEDEEYGIVGAAADGTMLTNTWKQMRVRKIHYGSDYGWLYFDDNGQVLEGWKTVNGKNYYFERGIMAVNKSLTMEDGALGIADGNGVLKKANRSGWTQVDGYWYYAVNGVAAKSTIRKIGKAYYGFDSDGRMYTNRTFYLDTEGDNHGMYHAQADGKLVRNGSWTAGNGDVYYFDANGIGYEGSHKVNGVTCFFENGRLLKNAAVKDQFGNLYVIDSKGVQHAMANNQWIHVDGYYYYALDGQVVKDDVVMINGKYYGFDEDGKMYDNVTFNMYGRIYHAASGGALLTAQQYKSGKDTYYFDIFGVGYEGVHYLAGKRCVFSEGKLVE